MAILSIGNDDENGKIEYRDEKGTVVVFSGGKRVVEGNPDFAKAFLLIDSLVNEKGPH
jgi:hypothetical protein